MKIIQITDTHLFSNEDAEIFGVRSNLKFKEVINRISKNEKHDTDIIFLTGDISQDQTIESYQDIASQLSKLNIPIYWIPGNHDDFKVATSVFIKEKNFNQTKTLSINNWHFIFINSTIEGRDDGELSQTGLVMLKDEILSSPPDKKIAIIMHHHPIPVGTPLIDNYILKNAHHFWNTISTTNVELVICGHVHGDYQLQNNKISIESSPATCFQWVKGTKDLKLDMKIGYKIYYFEQTNYRSLTKMW